MSIRKIFSRSTGTKNRHNESRKVARRQNLRKRLLGHETLEDRRLLAFDVFQGLGADLGVFDFAGEANDLVISNAGAPPGGPVNVTDTLNDYSGAGIGDPNFVAGTAAGVVPGSVDYSTTMPGPITSIFVDSGAGGTGDDDTVTVNANIGDIGITSVLLFDSEASTGDHAVIDADGNPVEIGAGGIVVNGVTIGISASFESIEIIGAGAGITFTGDAGDNTLTLFVDPVSGENTIDFGGIPIAIGDAALTFDGEGGDDEFIVDFTGGNPIPAGGVTANGGAGGEVFGDSITLMGGTVTDTTYEFDSATDGSINIDGSMIEYTGLEPVIDTLTATTRTFTFLGGAEAITLDDDATAGDGISEIDSTLGEIVAFLNPTTTLTINSGSGIDDVDIDGLDSVGAPPTIVVNTGTENDDLSIATGLGAIGVTTLTLDGGAGVTDVLNVATGGAAVVIDAAGGITVAGEPTITSTAFETINLIGASLVTVTGTGGADTFDVDFLADNMGSLDNGATRIHFGGSPLTINAGGGADTLVLDNTGAGNAINAITFNGEADADSIRLEGAAGTITQTFTNENDGTILVDAGLITYTGLEPITDNMVAAARVFTFTTTGITGTLTASPVSPGTHTRIDSGASELVDFVTPTASLEINLATGVSNTFSVNSLSDDYSTPTNDINLGDSGDTINMEVTGGTFVFSDQDWDINGGAGNDTLNLAPLDMNLNGLFDGIDFFGGGGATDTLNVDDSSNLAGGLTYTVTSTSIDQDGRFGEDSAPPIGVTYDAAVEAVNLFAGSAGNTIDVTSTSATATTTIVANGGADTYNIDASMLGGTNNFSGNDGNDTFNVNLTAAAGVTAPLTINGDAHDGGGGRDEVEINDLFGSALTAAINYIDAAGMTTLTGVGSTVTMNTAETIDFDGDGANDDTITVNGRAVVDDLLTVAPIDANRALVFNGGDPFDGPPEVFGTSLPGVSGGSAIPDLDLAGLSNATGLNIQDLGGAADLLYIYGQSATPLDDGNAFDPFGFGPGDVLPGVGDPAANDVITVSDTATTVNGFVVVNYDAVDFAQADPLTQPSVIVNAGEEANPVTPPADSDADNITLTLSPAYRFQVNGGNPDPAGTGVVPPSGDQLNVPGMFATINVYSNKVAPGLTPIVNFDFPGSGMQGFGYSSIEQLGTFSAQTVNLVGDNNNGANDQNDNFVVVGQDVDDFAVPAFPGNVIDGGVGEFVLNINGSLPIRFREVQFLNAFGDDLNPPPGTPSAGNDIDTFEVTPYADDTTRGWGIDVSFNEGNPPGADGDQADLLILHTALFGGMVSEDIVVRPSGPDNGEIVVTNASDGSLIVDIDYVANTDIIVLDDDGFLNDTDTLTLLGTNPDNPGTSGDETVVADFTAAGAVATPQITVNDGATILYRVRSMVGFDNLTFDLLGGNDQITVLGQTNGAGVNMDSLTVLGGTGDDTLILNNTNGLSTMSGGVTYHGGDGNDQLQFIGDMVLTSSTYDVGPTADAGRVTHVMGAGTQVVNFTGLEPVIDLVASPTLTINATGADNAITYEQSELNPAWGKVTVDGFEPIHFANKTSLVINAVGGSDAISLNNATVPTGLTGITINGGDPSTSSDSVEIIGTAADDTFAYTPTATNGGTVVQGGAIAMTYTLATIESLTIDAVGQVATDALTVTTANATITPGTDPGTGVVDPVSATGDPLLSLDYAAVETATVTGTTAVVQGTAENDTITVSAAGVVTVTNELGFTNSVDVSAFAAVVINALGGDDAITIDGAAVFAGGITVLGGDNGTSSDELNLSGADATAETVNISPSGTNGTNQTITGLGSTITVDGTELIVYDSTGGDDTLVVDPDFGSTMRIDSAPKANYDRAVSDSLPEIQWTNLLLFQATPGGATNDYTTTFVPSGLFGATSYELNPQANDQTLVIEGDGNADSFTLVNPATGEVEVTDDNRGITVTSIGAGLDLLRIVSLGGDDTVTVNVAPDVIGVPIEFDGGDGSDLLTVSGTPATAVDEVIYSPGAAVTEGRLVYENAANATLMTIDFANLEPVVDLVPAATLTVNGTNAANAINYDQSPTNAAWGRVSVDGFETIEFAQKANLTLNGLGGSDEISLNNPTTPTGLTGITVNGGDPTAGSDVAIISGTTGADAIDFAPTTDDDAVITGAGPVVITLAGVENAVIDAQGGNDTLTYTSPAGTDDLSFVSPGVSFSAGAVTGHQTAGALFELLPLAFTNFDNLFSGLVFADAGGGRTDNLEILGSDADDQFVVTAAGGVTLRRTATGDLSAPEITTPGIGQLVLQGLDGDDTFNIPGDHPFNDIAVEGGNPGSGSDVLNFTSAGAAVTVDLGLQTVVEAGFTAVSYSGIESINADAGGVGLNVVATTEDDDVTVTVLDANSGNVEHGYTMNRLGQPISAAAAPLVHYTNTGGAAVNVDLAAGEDTLNVVGNALAQTFNVDVTTSTVAIDDGPVVGNDGIVTYTNNESLGVFGLEGDDTFDVTPGAIPVFIDGGDPIGESAGDTINTNAGGAAVTFEGGPENDEGGILVAGSQRISYDHIEALGAIAAMKALIIGTNGDDDITVIARDASTHVLADGVQDFTVSVNDGPAILFIDTPELYIDALSGDDDIVLRTPAPNDASWDVEVFIAGGAPSDGAPNEGDRLVLETPGNDTIIYTPTGSDTGTILIDEDGDGINDGVIPGGVDSLITIGQFNVVCPGLNYTSDPGGVELFEYDGEGANDSLTIVSAQGDDTIVHTPDAGFDEGSLRVNTTLGVHYQNLGGAAVLTVADNGGNDTLVVNGTGSDDAFDVAATTGAVSLVTPSTTYLAINQTQIENLTLDGLDGNDDFVINSAQPYANINIFGGGPGGSDVLTVNGAAATDETFTVDPAFDRGDGTVSVNALLVPYIGIEHVLLDANFGDNDDLVINDDDADNLWVVDAGPIFGDRVQIDDRESFDFVDFNDVTLNNGFGTDQFDVYPTNLIGFDGNFTVNGDAAGGAEPIDDVLNILGTPGNDVVTSNATAVTTNGVTITAGANLVELSVQTFAGDDNITLALALQGVRKVVDAGAGDDNVNVSTMQDATIFGGLGDDIIVGSPLADLIYGGSGNDTISGLGGDDTIYGDEGNDTITGGTGDDNLFGGADSDLLIWNNGDNTDLMEGGTGNDRVQVNGAGGAAAGENYVISANGSRVTLQRTNLVPFTLDIAQVEQLDLNTDDSADDSEVVTVNSLVGTEIEVLNLDAGPDSNNQFIFNGNDSAETISIGPNEQILGLGPVINTSLVVGGGFSDTITINAAGGADTITVTDAVDADLVLNGGLGNDVIDASLQQAGFLLTINGDAGDDLLRGGAGNDIINGGAGEDSMVGNLGLDTFDGGTGFDTILVEGFASDDRIDVRQDNPTTLRHEVGNAGNGFDGVLGGAGTETDTLMINTVEQVSITAGAGDDTIRVAHDDSLVAAGVAIDMLRFNVDGGDPGASDRLTVTDDGLGDTTVQRLGQTDGDGSFTMYAFSGGNPANPIIALPPVVYTDVEYASLNPIGPVTGGTGTDSNGRLFVFKYDPFEQNQSLPTATFLGADSAINLDPTIDPGWDVNFNTPGDEDWYRVVAEKTGTLDFQVYFRQQGLLNNGRAGLPGNGDLEIAVYDADGLVGGVPLAIAGTGAFGINDADDNERVRIPAVAGQTYYLRVVGAALAVGDTPNASPAINVYNVSVVNTAPPVPYDLELNDILQVGTVSVNAANTITFTATLAPNNPSLAAPTIANDYIGKTVEFTSGLNIGRQATILNFAAGTFTLNAVGNALIAAPQAGDSFLVETTDTGRSQFDDATRDNTPVITFRLDDDLLLLDLGGNVVNPNVAPDQQIPIPFNAEQTLTPTTAGYRVPVFIEGNPQQPGTAPQTPIGYARPLVGTPGVYIFDFGVDAVQAVAGVDAALALTDGSHFINAKVEITDPSSDTVTDFAARSESLEIIVDTNAPEVYFGDPAVADDGLHPNSDSGVPFDPATLSDNATNDTTPTFFGRAEANSIIRAYVDRTNNGFTADDILIGQSVASPLDGSNQHPFGEWEITSTVNMNDPLLTASLGLDGVRNIYVTAEDVEGNTSDATLASLQIFIDTSGPQITDVFITNRPDFDLFTLKPATPEPTPRVDSITINVRDLPARVAGFLYPAISNLAVAPAVLPLGLIQLTGDHSGIIPMTSVTFTSDGNLNLAGVQPLAAGNPATGYITLQFAEPLPDDRFTLTLSDSIVDPAGNALDGESNASEPVGTPLFPSGDSIPGGDFVARFTVDSRPEVGTWSQELVYIDINGNFVWDPEGQDNDATNRDFIYHFGTTTDAYFAGNFNSNFVGPDGIFETPDDAPVLIDNVPSSGFDKMGTFGRFNGLYEFFLDTNDDGIGDTVGPMFYQVNVIPVAGNFFNSTADNAAVANGQRPRDEIGGFDGQNWYLDINGDNAINAGERFATELRGIPVVGDFNGDGNDDLATFNNATGVFQFDLDRDGTVDDTLTFFFSGFGEKPVAGDVNLDGIDDIVLWVPNRDGQLPENAGEFHYLVSDNPGAALPSAVFNSYSPAPLGNDLIAQFGDDFALPILGNFDPPIGDIDPIDTTGWFTNLNNSLDVDNDGHVDSYDALLVINALNRGITSAEPSQAIRVRNAFNGHFLDVDGSTSIDPYDVLLIINELNRVSRAGQGEAAPSTAASYAAAVDSVFSSDEDDDDLLLDFADNDALRNTL